MSLLLEALKKAELAKQIAKGEARSAEPQSAPTEDAPGVITRETARHLAVAGDPHRRFALVWNEGRGDARGKARIVAGGTGQVRACGAADACDERIRTHV